MLAAALTFFAIDSAALAAIVVRLVRPGDAVGAVIPGGLLVIGGALLVAARAVS